MNYALAGTGRVGDDGIHEIQRRIGGHAKTLKAYERKIGSLYGGGVKSLVQRGVSRALTAASHLPVAGRALAHVAEISDPFHRMEYGLKTHLGNVQGTVNNAIGVARKKREEIYRLRETRDKALAEDWNPTRLREFIAGYSGLPMDTDTDMNRLLEMVDEGGEVKQRMLDMLGNLVDVETEAERYLGVVVAEGLQVYDAALLQYASFMGLKPYLQAMRGSAMATADAAKLYSGTTEAVQGYLGKVTDLAVASMQAIPVIRETHLATPGFRDVLARERDRVEAAYRKATGLALPSPDVEKKKITPRNKKGGKVVRQ